jgi:hypothetical protein
MFEFETQIIGHLSLPAAGTDCLLPGQFMSQAVNA